MTDGRILLAMERKYYLSNYFLIYFVTSPLIVTQMNFVEDKDIYFEYLIG